MFIWIQLSNFSNSSLVTSIIFAHRIGNAYTVKILNFIRSSRPEMFRPATLLKKRLCTSVSLWILQNFWKHFFLQNTSCGCFCFVAIELYVFLVESFQFSRFHENVDKLEWGNFKRGFTMTFMVKNFLNYWEKWLKILQASFFLWIIKQTVYKFSKIWAK